MKWMYIRIHALVEVSMINYIPHTAALGGYILDTYMYIYIYMYAIIILILVGLIFVSESMFLYIWIKEGNIYMVVFCSM